MGTRGYQKETIFYIDLRDYEWEIGTNRWTQIEQVYPYGIAFDAPTQTSLREKLTNLREELACEVPFVHVDWFLATASLPPLYHDILDLPQTDRELESQLEVNVVENTRNAAGRRVWRAGFNDSGVSSNNRVVERHTSRYGAYWKSYDFAGSVGTQNIFTHPLSFTHDGGEIIFNLPNGLQAYYLVDAGGNRLDAAPISIVSNPAASDPTVRNGLSCIGCHTEGMKEFEDQVRAVVKQNPNPPFDKARALRLYTEQSVMAAHVEKDTTRYRQALEASGDVFGGIEPVQRFYEAFQRPLDAAHAAAAVDLEIETFLRKIRENASLKNLGLGVLTSASGSVKRDTWTSNFSEIVATLSSPDSSVVKPVAPREERIPGESVHIPDPNLRAAIAEALGKTPKSTITVEEMATLTHLTAEGMGIKDLRGLEFATNLQNLRIKDNVMLDLSPIAGLTQLGLLGLSGNEITDISPLAELKNLGSLGIYSNEISDISPLSGLTNLRGLSMYNNPVSDLSPLANLKNLNWIRVRVEPPGDLSPLAELINLESIEYWGLGEPVPDLSPLTKLPKLVKIGIEDVSKVDVSPLSGLTAIKELWLPNCGISNLSFLEKLTTLERANLGHNNISDISALSALPNLKWLDLRENQISDFSPLDGVR
ncbi:leucine-rich repeat domain-containing protein, partial [Candidatus Poribacteria bacterium]|nr:leucine-rich repeat domain-containing protein [Candidatus Poribacteria bacterium]